MEGVLAALRKSLEAVRESALALLPIVLVIVFFQLVLLREPIPNLGEILAGALMVMAGLALFVRGLQMALFPIGEEMAYNFVRRGNIWWLLLFAFTLGFGTTVAEPALIAISDEAARVAASGMVIDNTLEAQADYPAGIRFRRRDHFHRHRSAGGGAGPGPGGIHSRPQPDTRRLWSHCLRQPVPHNDRHGLCTAG